MSPHPRPRRLFHMTVLILVLILIGLQVLILILEDDKPDLVPCLLFTIKKQKLGDNEGKYIGIELRST